MSGIKLLLYIFLVVISNPYEGIDYNKVNTYDVNYCHGVDCPDHDPNYYADFLNDDDEEYEEEESFEKESEEKLFIFDIDSLVKKK